MTEEHPQQDQKPQNDEPQNDKKDKKSLADEEGSPRPDPKAVISPKGLIYIALWVLSLLQFALWANVPYYGFESAYEALLAHGVLTWLWCFVGLLLLVIAPLVAKMRNVVRFFELGVLGVLIFWGFINSLVASIKCNHGNSNGRGICQAWKGDVVASLFFSWISVAVLVLLFLFTLYQMSVLDRNQDAKEKKEKEEQTA